MANQWMITDDFIDDGLNNGRKSIGFKSGKEMKVRFRIYDDDGILYFAGVSERHDFHPLDDFAVSYGCTMLKTKVSGSWQVL